MSTYSLTMLLKNNLDDEKRKGILDAVKGKIDDGGKVTKEDLWGSKNLAYKIKHQDKAYYAHFEFESEPAKIFSLDKIVKLNEDVIRYLLIRK